MPLKIALVCDWYSPRLGGIESQLSDLAHALRARGHDPHVITATPGPREGDLPVHRLRAALVPGWGVIGNREPVGELEAIFARERFDVVHGHSLYSPLALSAMWLARRDRLASVLTSHSLVDPAARFLLRSLERRYGWADWPGVLTAVSSLAADDVRAASGRSEVLLLRNGIDLKPWRAPARRERELVEVVSVMRLCRRKRPLALLRAIPGVVAACPGARFTLVGDGPLRAIAEDEARSLGITARVRFAGAQPRAAVRARLHAADLFVLPTVKEAFGIAVLEARAAGLPVVAMRASGASDLIEHGREGLLAEDDPDLETQLIRLCRDPELRGRLAAEAPRRLERYSWREVVDEHLERYRLALARGGLAARAAAA